MLKELCVSTFKVEYICSTLNALGLSRIHVRKGMSGTPPSRQKNALFRKNGVLSSHSAMATHLHALRSPCEKKKRRVRPACDAAH
jgi:hypothetical protein